VTAAYRKPGLVLVGIGAVVGFSLVNCHFNINQRNIISGNPEIEATRVGALSLYAFISVCLLVEIVLLLF
jgi:hypothetical protein